MRQKKIIFSFFYVLKIFLPVEVHGLVIWYRSEIGRLRKKSLRKSHCDWHWSAKPLIG